MYVRGLRSTTRRQQERHLKVNFRSFSFFSDYSYPLTLSNVGKLYWSWIPWDHSQFRNREISVMHVQSCCFAYITLLFSDVLVVVHVVVKVRNVTNARAPSLGHRLSLFSELSYWFTFIWTQFFLNVFKVPCFIKQPNWSRNKYCDNLKFTVAGDTK